MAALSTAIEAGRSSSIVTEGLPTSATKRPARRTPGVCPRPSRTRPGTVKLVVVNGAARRPRSTLMIRGRRSDSTAKPTSTRSPGRSPPAGSATARPSRSSADSPQTEAPRKGSLEAWARTISTSTVAPESSARLSSWGATMVARIASWAATITYMRDRRETPARLRVMPWPSRTAAPGAVARPRPRPARPTRRRTRFALRRRRLLSPLRRRARSRQTVRRPMDRSRAGWRRTPGKPSDCQ